MAPSGGSQVDIPDVCRGGGLIQLVQGFSAGASLCLLVLLLLLPAFAQTAQQHTLDLLLALFENILNTGNKQKKKDVNDNISSIQFSKSHSFHCFYCNNKT